MQDLIEQLEDEQAERILLVVARHGFEGSVPATLDYELRSALSDALHVESSTQGGSRGELAREALCLLAASPQHRPALEAIIQGPAPERVEIFSGISRTGAAPVVMLLSRRTKCCRRRLFRFLEIPTYMQFCREPLLAERT